MLFMLQHSSMPPATGGEMLILASHPPVLDSRLRKKTSLSNAHFKPTTFRFSSRLYVPDFDADERSLHFACRSSSNAVHLRLIPIEAERESTWILTANRRVSRIREPVVYHLPDVPLLVEPYAPSSLFSTDDTCRGCEIHYATKC